MKKVICVFSLAVAFQMAAFAQTNISEPEAHSVKLQSNDHDSTEFPAVESPQAEKARPTRVKAGLPAFAGGNKALTKYIDEAFIYPEIAREAGIEGTVKVKFKINREGKPENARVIQSLGYGCDEEALRLIANMPTWVPAHQGPVKVSTFVVLDINFRLI